VDFLANENFPLVSVRLLRAAGHDVKTVLEELPAGSKDSEVLVVAKEQQRVILTFDRDYGELIYRYRFSTPVGIVYFRFTPSAPEEPAVLLNNIIEKGKRTLEGKFTVVERERIRQRNLKNE